MDYRTLRRHFEHPESIDRSAPFWSWNDRMDPKEVKAQAHDMVEKGMGGYFIHARVGLETEYLGKEWMDCVKACVEQAAEDGAYAWLYDEDRYPSGAAGGLVTRDRKEFAAKGISLTISEKRELPEKEVLFTYAAVMEGDKLVTARLLEKEEQKGQGEIYLHISLSYYPPLAWYNSAPPADNLNRECVARFIEVTMEAYKEAVGDSFGSTVPGVFTDEPNVSLIPGCYSYTYELPSFFKNKRGYAVTDILPWLFLPGEQTRIARHDYFHTIYEMFAEHFSMQFHDWCKKNNLFLTGHYLLENHMGTYILLNGGILLNYLYQDIPGIDILGEYTQEYMTVKGCTSVANQTGRNRTLSETYGVCGWQFSFEAQKWIGDFQYVQGINLRCQHLTWYSMKGMCKRDYPPQFNYQTTWWEYNNIVEDYFARIGALTSKGKAHCEVLVIHPLATVWTITSTVDRDKEEGNRIGLEFNDYTRNLLSNHIDFDYGDEDIIAKIGSVRGKEFLVGEGTYRTIIIPPGVETLYRSTAELLLAFMNNGGTVLCENADIRYLEARENPMTAKLTGHGNFRKTSSIRETVSLLNREISVQNPAGGEEPDVFCMVRDYGGPRMVFLINNDRDKEKPVTVLLQGYGGMEEWDLLTGEVRDIPCAIRGQHLYFKCLLGACDSKLFILNPDKKPIPFRKGLEKKYLFLQGLGIACPFHRTHPNVLVLDMCRFMPENGEWGHTDELWRHQKAWRESLDMIPIHGNGGIQRYRWIGEPHVNDGKKLRIQFLFEADYVPEDVKLAVEDIENFRIFLNGREISSQRTGWAVDKCMGTVILNGIRKGSNELVLECIYRQNTQLENVFLLGDFAVTIQRVLVKEPETLRLGDWGLQGYFHYHGGMRYQYVFHYKKEMGDDILLDMGSYQAVVAIIRINGHTFPVPWKCKGKVQIAPVLKEGDNVIEVELMGSPRNMFGPLHLSNTREKWIGCGQIHPEKHLYTSEYTTYPWGMMEQICIYGR